MTRTAITNALIVTVDADDSIINGGTIVITDDTITEILPAGDSPSSTVDVTVDAHGGIVMPGLINAHTHFAMTA
ncbi:MAG: hypothetical protein WCJ88_12985, partial [Actinomycetes bacterium]